MYVIRITYSYNKVMLRKVNVTKILRENTFITYYSISKSPHKNRPTQLKPMFLKGQLSWQTQFSWLYARGKFLAPLHSVFFRNLKVVVRTKWNNHRDYLALSLALRKQPNVYISWLISSSGNLIISNLFPKPRKIKNWSKTSIN